MPWAQRSQQREGWPWRQTTSRCHTHQSENRLQEGKGCVHRVIIFNVSEDELAEMMCASLLKREQAARGHRLLDVWRRRNCVGRGPAQLFKLQCRGVTAHARAAARSRAGAVLLVLTVIAHFPLLVSWARFRGGRTWAAKGQGEGGGERSGSVPKQFCG